MSPRHLPYDQLTHGEILFALGEEIGDPEIFVGRKKEMARLMNWAEGTKRRISGSMGILARRKKGKTALLQRFFNLLYTRQDPQLIPFYYRVKEERLTKRAFAIEFYCSLLSQYFAFTTRTSDLVARPLSFNGLEELAKADPRSPRTLGGCGRSSKTILRRRGPTPKMPGTASRSSTKFASSKSSTNFST